MKRWFSLALVALFLVPVLVVPAAAAEVYEFEYMELPSTYSVDFSFEWSDPFMYFGTVPPGVYILQWNIDGVAGSWPDPVVLSFDMIFELDGALCSGSMFETSDHVEWGAIFIPDHGVTLLILPFDMGTFEHATATLTRVGDLPSQGGFASMFEDFSAFTGSCVNFVSEVAKTITGSPLLLLTCGFLFLGGCIGITGRLLSRG